MTDTPVANSAGDGDDSAPAPRARRWIRCGGWIAAVAASAGVLLHLTIKDAVWPLSAAFYGLPCWICFTGAVVAAIAFRLSGSRRGGQVCAALSLACLVWCVAKDLRPLTAAPDRDATFRLAMWNPFQGTRGWPEIAEAIDSFDADLVCLVEGGGRSPKQRAFWADALPHLPSHHLGYGYVVLSHYPVTLVSDPLDEPLDDRVEVDVNIDGTTVRVILFHTLSSPVFDRSDVAASLVRRANETTSEPTIICGDFNLPADSALLEPLRPAYALASDGAGFFHRPTWPMPVPVLTLDQVWLGGGLQTAGCRHHWSNLSDHRAVIVDVAIGPPPDAGSDEAE